MSTELPTDPKAIKKIEKAIAKEARADEKDYQKAMKEFRRTEKSEAKTSKAANKAEKRLKKMESKELDTIRSLQKATYKHDQAVTGLHTAQSDVGVQKQYAQRLRKNTETLRARADELLRAKQAREVERDRRLAHLHPPADPERPSATTE